MMSVSNLTSNIDICLRTNLQTDNLFESQFTVSNRTISRSRRAHAQQFPLKRRATAAAAGSSKCFNEPVQRCEKVRLNPRPVARAVRKRVCRDPADTDADRVREIISLSRDRRDNICM